MKQVARNLLAGVAIAAGLIGPAAQAADKHAHDAHGEAVALQLNGGKKWQTDEPLRHSMAQIREWMHASLDAIHRNTLANAAYDRLAGQVESEVGRIVANCKLEPKADAQLHLIIEEILAGAEQMAGKHKTAKRQNGAEKVVQALSNYARYFDDARFKPIAH